MSVFTAVLKKEIVADKKLNVAIGVSAFALATALSAYVKIYLPFTPVPMTLQTFFVLLSGAFLGRRLGALSQGAYMAFGAAGVPVFAAGAYGLSHVFGPTGGYLAGFVAAAYLVGMAVARKQKNSLFLIMSSMALGAVVYFSLGALWLCAFTGMSLASAFYLGVLPFIAGDIVKIVAASCLYYRFQGRIRQIF